MKTIYESWVGKDIQKKSNKPFKSTLRIMIPIGMVISHYTNNFAFKFADGTIVDCRVCKLIENNI